MVKTRSVFFWMAGVITPSLPALLSNALSHLGKSEVNLLALPGFAPGCEALALGQTGQEAFCAALCEQAGLLGSGADLEEKIQAGLAALPQVLETIDLLPEAYERWLIVDLPPAWAEAAADKIGLDRYFRADRHILLPGSGLVKLMPEVLYHLATLAQVPLSEGLLINASARRAVTALQHGMQAAIFVDARRLEREFTMRYLIDRPQPVHKPK